MRQFNSLEDLSVVANRFKQSDDILEPFDPEYLTNEPYKVPDISSEEMGFFHKVIILQNALRKSRIRATWMPNEQMFRVQKILPWTNTPSYMYIAIYMDTDEYAFGGWEEDLIVDNKVSAVVSAVKKWLTNNQPSLR